MRAGQRIVTVVMKLQLVGLNPVTHMQKLDTSREQTTAMSPPAKAILGAEYRSSSGVLKRGRDGGEVWSGAT